MEQLIIPKDTKQLLVLLQRFATEHQETDMQNILYQVQKIVDQEENTAIVTQKIQKKSSQSRWAKLSEEIKKDPPLRGLGDYVRVCSKELRQDFALNHEEE